MRSGFVAVFLGFVYLWYLLFREQTQASENPRERTPRHRYILYGERKKIQRLTPKASYITIKIVISYKISRIFFFFCFSFLFLFHFGIPWTEIIFLYPKLKQNFFLFSFFLTFLLYDVGIPTDLFLYYTSSSFRLMLPSTGNSRRSPRHSVGRQWPRLTREPWRCSQPTNFNQANSFWFRVFLLLARSFASILPCLSGTKLALERRHGRDFARDEV